MRTQKRTKKQWEQTHQTREDVRKFMQQFHGNLMWEMDGPPDTEVDQLLCYLIYSRTKDANDQFPSLGVAIIQTWLRGGYSIFVESSAAMTEITVDEEVTLPDFLPPIIHPILPGKTRMVQSKGEHKGHVIHCDSNNTAFWEAEGYVAVGSGHAAI